MQQLRFIDEEWSWKNMTLWDFLNEGNYPRSDKFWEKFFIDHSSELYKISEEITKESSNSIIYPPIHQVFRAFIPVNKIKVVILGQDPYFNGSAIGLCFSVLPGNAINPSLRNIYQELKQEGYTPNENGNLTHWAKQGCFMLNTALTVEKNSAESHTGIWYDFTEQLLKHVATHTKNIVWVLMGAKALEFQHCIDKEHKVFITSHPSPFSAYKGFRNHPAFLGSRIFQNINKFLKDQGKQPISW